MTENALVGEVVVQEKVDGSQFRFGINEDGKFVAGSKSVNWDESNPVGGMFAEGHSYIEEAVQAISMTIPPDTYFYGEYLKSPKHNTLTYDRVPMNHIVLFDVLQGGKWLDRNEVEDYAAHLGIDVVPEVLRGKATMEDVMNVLNQTSFLGGATAEGVVVKNYGQTFLLGGKVFPLFTKYVREEFKELHKSNPDWKPRKSKLEEFIESFRTEARWQKAFQYLRDANELEQSPRDIPNVIKRIIKDIEEEEANTIKEFGFELLFKDISRRATAGAAEWYKAKLLENVKEE